MKVQIGVYRDVGQEYTIAHLLYVGLQVMWRIDSIFQENKI